MDRFSEWSTVKICKTPETEEMTQFFQIVLIYREDRNKSDPMKRAPLSQKKSRIPEKPEHTN